MTTYGRPPWIDRCPPSRIPAFPKQRGPLDVDVAIIGGGLTGCLAAYTFASTGARVVLVEADRIGHGTTARSAGIISEEPGVTFESVESQLGLRAARRAFQGWRRAALDFTALLRRLNIPFEPGKGVLVALTPEQTARLTRERAARVEADLEAPVVKPREISSELAISANLGLRDKAAASVDPYRTCIAIARAAAERGAQLFERTPARRTKFGRKNAQVVTAAGAIRTRYVVVATGAPNDLFRSLIRHFWYRTSYLVLTDRVGAKVRRSLGRSTSILRDLAEPPHIVRWVDEQLLVSGADQEAPPDRQREKALVQRTGQLMYELSTLYPDISGIPPTLGWDAPYARSADGLPCLGPHRNFPWHLFAFGDSSQSLTGAYLASRVVLRCFLGEDDPMDTPFEFTRHGR